MAVPGTDKRLFTSIAMTHPSKVGILHCGIPRGGQMRRRTGNFSF